MSLNERQIRFAIGVASGQTDKDAYVSAGYEPNNAEKNAHKLRGNTEIEALIAERRERYALSVGIDKTLVLSEWIKIATADPNELIHVRRVNCRFCWGIDHKFQWTARGYEEALNRALDADEPKPAPDFAGGLGFDETREPAGDCPDCNGEGRELVRAADTRNLKGNARRLYAGAKQTKDGIVILMRDQDAALQNIAKYLGMVVDKKELSGPGGGPLVVKTDPREATEEELMKIALTDN